MRDVQGILTVGPELVFEDIENSSVSPRLALAQHLQQAKSLHVLKGELCLFACGDLDPTYLCEALFHLSERRVGQVHHVHSIIAATQRSFACAKTKTSGHVGGWSVGGFFWYTTLYLYMYLYVL